jgi:hypothetical protein
VKRVIVAPDLQELVAAFGGYDKITLEGWAAWDRANAEYQQYRRDVLLEERARGRRGKEQG